jgi:hypothetical protein
MKIETRKRNSGGPLNLVHHDLCLIPEDEEESKMIDLLGQPGSVVRGEIRLSDGYGSHYMLVQPSRIILPSGDVREFEGIESELLEALKYIRNYARLADLSDWTANKLDKLIAKAEGRS